MNLNAKITLYLLSILALLVSCEIKQNSLVSPQHQNSEFIDIEQSLYKSESGIIINELYISGPVESNFYSYDQFIELYNASETIQYLDGLIISRVGSKNGILKPLRSFQFPGTPLIGHDYPLDPGSYCVIAKNAVNHSDYTNGYSPDLSGADWEFYSVVDPKDLDNPDVPNLNNINLENSKDFFLNLYNDAVILSDGSDGYCCDGIDEETIIDAVEYSADINQEKFIAMNLDSTYTGIGIFPFSGKSFERKLPGFDTDNSYSDFTTINVPSPGF